MGNTCFIGKGIEVEQLSVSSCTEAHKTLEYRQILNFYDLPEVSLDTGCRITGKPVALEHVLRMEGGMTQWEQRGHAKAIYHVERDIVPWERCIM